MAKTASVNNTNDKNEIKKENIDLSETLGEFLLRNRKIFITGILIIGGFIFCFIAGMVIRDFIRSRSLTAVEALHERYDALKYEIQDPFKTEEVETLLQDLQTFAQRTGGYSGAWAFNMIASIHYDRKNWTEAESAWVSAARKNRSSYLAPVALFNAGVAAEEAGMIDEALVHYQAVLGYTDNFSEAARAQFAIGRLQEEGKGNRDAALEAYRQLLEKFPNESDWTSLANSRIIALSGLNP